MKTGECVSFLQSSNSRFISNQEWKFFFGGGGESKASKLPIKDISIKLRENLPLRLLLLGFVAILNARNVMTKSEIVVMKAWCIQ